MDDFMTKYNEYREKWERIDKIKEQISLCVAMNMPKPTLVKSTYIEFYELRIMYLGQEFICAFTTSGKPNLPYVKDKIAYHILKWECKERGLEYPPRLTSSE